ncbi:pol, partial [Symbiodinium sp. KB8]
PVQAATSYIWALARRVLNRLAHICTGNISAWAGVAAALAAPVLLSVQRGSVGVVDETLAAVAQQSAELVQEVGAEAARTVQVAGRAVSIITLMLCAAATWFVARTVLNRLVHALKGNSLPAVLVELLIGGEATFAVQGKRSQAMHKVWAAVQMGLVRADLAALHQLRRVTGVFQRSGLAAKSRDSCLSGLLNRGGSSPGAPAATRNKTPRAESSSRAVHEVAYLAGGSYVAAGLDVLAKTRSRDKALEAACVRGAACSLVADASQCAKTKLQWQSLKRVAAAGVNVPLAAGHSVRDAYVADGRGTAVGAGLKGLRHAKALLVVGETTADLIVGSLNWSTSST